MPLSANQRQPGSKGRPFGASIKPFIFLYVIRSVSLLCPTSTAGTKMGGVHGVIENEVNVKISRTEFTDILVETFHVFYFAS